MHKIGTFDSADLLLSEDVWRVLTHGRHVEGEDDGRVAAVRAAAVTEILRAQGAGQGPADAEIACRVALYWCGWTELRFGLALTADEHLRLVLQSPLPALPKTAADWAREERRAAEAVRALSAETIASVAVPPDAPPPAAPPPIPTAAISAPTARWAQVREQTRVAGACGVLVAIGPDSCGLPAAGPLPGFAPADTSWMPGELAWWYRVDRAHAKVWKAAAKAAMRDAGYRVLAERANPYAELKRAG
jgi:hypothetical protein